MAERHGENHDEHGGKEEVEDVQLTRLRSLARSLEADDLALVPPPEAVWEDIVAALSGDGATDAPSRPVAGPSRGGAPSRWRRPPLLLAAAVLALVVGLTGVAALAVGRGDDPSRELQRIALGNEGLDPRGATASGTAGLVERGAGYELAVDLGDLEQVAEGYLELWLIDRDVAGMVSLGPYRGPGRYLVPAGVDPAAFPVVDVSDEPVDGDPTHSGVSLLRGQLA